MASLSAVKVGIFVVQAAGNTGSSPNSMSSFSPWIFTVDSASHDRTYSNSITLGTTSPFLELDLHGPLQKKMSKWLHVLMIYILIVIFTQWSCNLKRLSSNEL